MGKQIQAIINVFKKNKNKLLDYNEIYEQMDKSVFGSNKWGVQGQKNIVYRLMLGNPLFEINENYIPKKFKVRLNVLKAKDLPGVENIYSTGDTSIFVDNKKFEEVKFPSEKDFENEIKSNHELIFGKNTSYYDIKSKVGNRRCDGLVFDPKNKRGYIVEAELSIHSLYGHIIPQIIDFFTNMKDAQTKDDLKWGIPWKKNEKLDIHEAIDKERYDIIVILDKINFETDEAKNNIAELIKNFVKNKDMQILFREFNVYLGPKKKKIFRVK
ncbi:MAG TPA: hypothetical protein HA362_07990 [Nanoarchaeota archaeon]|nr:hypothetical protein [Nanoarchaeota archaeon]